ncbi:MAG: tetratricopeptide repeat protein [Acidobacteriota bacterium]
MSSTGGSACSECSHELRAGAKFCDECGHRVADRPKQPVASAQEMRTITVLFADMKGFTSLSEQLDPADVHDVVDRVFAITDRCIQEQDGHVEKHVGDAVMALFGAPKAHEDDAARAIRAALRFQSEIEQLADELESEGFPRIALRTGINTGRVVVGTVGVDGESSVFGDTVNVASRVETACPAGGILVSHDTYRQVRGLFEVDSRPPLRVKGKKEPLHTYLVRSEKSAHLFIGTHEVLGAETEMVGREIELGRLEAALDRVRRRRRPELITITGTPGLGKTRLLHEFLKRVEASPDNVFLMRARAALESIDEPFHLLGELVRTGAGIRPDQGAEPARTALAEHLQHWLGAAEAPFGVPYPDAALPAEEIEEATHFIGELVGMPFPDSAAVRSAGGDARQVRQRAMYAVEQVIARRAGAAPVVIELEDLHWADTPSLELFEHLVQVIEDRPVLVVGSARPELGTRLPNWGQGSEHVSSIRLEPLDQDVMQDLCAHLLDSVQGLPSDLASDISKRAAGTPYFAEEMIKSLADLGVIESYGGQWVFHHDRLVALEIPASVEGVLQARLDRLEPHERCAARNAAVIGRGFWDDALQAIWQQAAERELMEPPQERVRATVDRLCAREIAQAQPVSVFPRSAEFAFVHDLMRDVAYRGLVPKVRKQLHLLVAEWLEREVGDRAGEWVATIAGHYEAGGDTNRAAQWYLRTAEASRRRHANEDALRLLDRAIALGGLDGDSAVRAYLDRARLRERIGEWDDAVADLEIAVQRAEEHELTALQSRCLSVLSGLHTMRGRLDEAEAAGRRALELARELESKDLEADALSRLAGIGRRRGQLEETRQLHEQCLALRRELGDDLALANGLRSLAGLHISLDQTDEAMRLYEQARELHHRAKDRAGLAECLHFIAYVMHHRGDHARAIDLYEESLDIRRAIGDRPYTAWNLHNLAHIHMDAGDHEKAAALVEEERKVSSAAGNRPGEAYGLMNVGALAAWSGDLTMARATYRRSLAIFRETGERPLQAVLLDSLAEIHRALGQVDVALTMNDEAAELHGRVDVRNRLMRAELEWQRGDTDAALDLLDEIATLVKSEHRPLVLEVKVQQARLAHARGAGNAASLAQSAESLSRRTSCARGLELAARALDWTALGAVTATEWVTLAEKAHARASSRWDGIVRILALESVLGMDAHEEAARLRALPCRSRDAAESQRLETLLAS